jgi:hypothetical protein
MSPNENANKSANEGESFLSFVDGMPVAEQLHEAAVNRGLDAVRSTNEPVLSPSAAFTPPPTANPAEYFDWDMLDGYSLPDDTVMVPESSSSRLEPVTVAAPRRSNSSPALLSSTPVSAPLASSTVNTKKKNNLLSRAVSVLPVPLLNLGAAFRAVGGWITSFKTTSTNHSSARQRIARNTQAYKRFVFSAGSSPTQEKNTSVPAAAARTTPPKLGSKDTVPFDLAAGKQGRNPLKRYVSQPASLSPGPAQAATTSALTPKTVLARSFDQIDLQAPNKQARTVLTPTNSDHEVSFAEGIPDCEPMRTRGAGMSFSSPTQHTEHDIPRPPRATNVELNSTPRVQINTLQKVNSAQRKDLSARESQLTASMSAQERQLRVMEQQTEIMAAFARSQSQAASTSKSSDVVRVRDVTLPKFSGNPVNSASYIHSTQYLPLLMWFSNAKRVTAAAGLNTAQSVRCIAGHLTGAAQRLFFEQLEGQLSDYSLSDFGSRLMCMIPGHATQFMHEVTDLVFDRSSLFNSTKRFELLWQYSHLDNSNGTFVHALLKRKLDSCVPNLLTNAWHHCQLDFHHTTGDDLFSLTSRLTKILTALQAEGKLPVQHDKAKDVSEDKSNKVEASDKPATAGKGNEKEGKGKKRGRPESTGDSPSKKKERTLYHSLDVEKWAKANKYCMRCVKPLDGVNILTHLKSDSCMKNRPTQPEAESALRKLMAAKSKSK